MNYIGDYTAGSRIDFEWCFTDTTGLGTAVTSGSACVRKLDASTAAAGTLAPLGVAAITTSGGQTHLTIFTGSDSVFFASGHDYHAFMGYGTVGGTSIVGYTVGHFSIINRGGVNVAQWNGTAVSTPATAGIPDVNIKNVNNAAVNTTAAQLGVNVVTWLAGTPNALISGRVDSNAAAVTVSADVLKISGSNVNTSTAQLGVNVVQWLTGTPNSLISGRVDANAAAVTVSADVLKIAGAAVNTSLAQLGVNIVNAGGSAIQQTGGYLTCSANVIQWLTSTPNALIAGRVDSNTQAMANAVIASTKFAAGAVDSAAMAASAENAIADAILLRDLATGASATTRNVQNALRTLRNLNQITGSSNPYTYTVMQEDDATPAWTAQLTFSANTFGVSTVDPA